MQTTPPLSPPFIELEDDENCNEKIIDSFSCEGSVYREKSPEIKKKKVKKVEKKPTLKKKNCKRPIL